MFEERKNGTNTVMNIKCDFVGCENQDSVFYDTREKANYALYERGWVVDTLKRKHFCKDHADKPRPAKRPVGAIEQEIEWCKAHMGESGNGIEFEKGFIAGLKQAAELLAKAKAANRGKTTLSWSDAVLHSYSERWAESGVYHLEWVDADHVRLTKVDRSVTLFLSGGESHPPRR